MSIRPVDMSGITMRTQDMSTIKQNEDNKPFAQQFEMQVEHDKNEKRRAEQVHDADDTQDKESRFDAKEKGSNEYENNRKWSKRHQKEKSKEDKVVVKNNTGFDIRI